MVKGKGGIYPKLTGHLEKKRSTFHSKNQHQNQLPPEKKKRHLSERKTGTNYKRKGVITRRKMTLVRYDRGHFRINGVVIRDEMGHLLQS